MKQTQLKEADKAEITVLVDNYADLFLADTDIAKRMRVLPPVAPMAEPGLSYLIKVCSGEKTHTLLFDTGISGYCLLHNTKNFASSRAVLMGEVTAKFEEMEAVILSHGHFDHCGGLLDVFKTVDKRLPVILHEEAFALRRVKIMPEVKADLPAMDEEEVVKAGADLQKINGPRTVCSDLVLLSGNVKRQTDFEKGMPGAEALINGKWIPDPFHDDMAVAINLKSKGLVVVGGCSHAGIINTVEHLKSETGISSVYAVMGGFHLGGGNERIIEPTINEMKKINPEIIVPMHCTGWNAINRFAMAMPDNFILNSVGTTYIFK
ncbi:MAG: MBL fold metallo-hydrolase [Proteobacteria bacterium]|nr:MBL fold metallo-hydrolase [Pseudomonadota bacterium]MBU1386244.1 MBL fold metallo-hydrolase [Pseudomonadota bacterium]MBU1542937.1 MBL fold metallo-hydrolase [Pseudomonadota bacterium]MBU2481612.1 MBL fold metallo-hydrolase [Pseudomonadota bacterium]